MSMESFMSLPPSEFVNQISRAGAGAGKTTQLTLKVIELVKEKLAKGEEPPRLVVTTFTRKATQELRERLLAKALELQDPQLIQFMNSKSRLQISTIHGVLSLFLSRYGHLIGLDSQFRFHSELVSKRLLKAALREALVRNDASESILEVYKFEDIEKMLMSFYETWLATPGLSFVSLEELKKALGTQLDLLARNCTSIAEDIVSETSHASWADCAARFHEAARILGTWSNDGVSRLELMMEGWRKPSAKGLSEKTSERVSEYKDALKDLLEPCYREVYFKQHEELCEKFQSLAYDFSQTLFNMKMSQAKLSMSDLESLSLKILELYPECGDSFSKEWDYWLVDEYQDTSPLQVTLLRQLSGQAPQFVVGDPQQSIYLFRGARTEVFIEKEREMREKGGLFKPLMKNYRSEPSLLEFMNDYFTKLSKQFGKMEAREPAEAKANEEIAQIMICEPEEGRDNDEIEADATLYRIQELLKQGAAPEQIVILARKNSQLSKVAQKAEEAGIPVQLHASAQFFDRREIKDALSLLKFLINPHDNLNLLELLRSPWLKVPDAILATHCHRSSVSYWSDLKKLPEPSIQRLQKVLQDVRTRSVSQAWLDQLVQLGFFDSALMHDATGKREANLWKIVHSLFNQERQKGFSYHAFLEEASWALRGGDGEESDAVPVVESKRVNLMTVHASKGLQFPHVILPFFGKDRKINSTAAIQYSPDKSKWSLALVGDDGQLKGSLVSLLWKEELRKREAEEADRVLYVAMTRAQKTVSFVWNSKLDKSSWAARFPLPLGEGLNKAGFYSYNVRRGPFQPEKAQPQERPLSAIRNKWQALAPTHVEASSFSSEHQVELKGMNVNFLLNMTKASEHGTLVHRLMEALKYRTPEDLDKWLTTEKRGAEIKKALQYVVNLKKPNLKSLLVNGEVEWGFAYAEAGQKYQGQIDLWGRDDESQLWVVDYKTGSRDFEDKAFEQLDSYIKALRICRKADASETVMRAVIYPFTQEVVIR